MERKGRKGRRRGRRRERRREKRRGRRRGEEEEGEEEGVVREAGGGEGRGRRRDVKHTVTIVAISQWFEEKSTTHEDMCISYLHARWGCGGMSTPSSAVVSVRL